MPHAIPKTHSAFYPHRSHQSLRRQRRLRVSQSVNASRLWRKKSCFASRGEQITEGTQRQLHFLISLEFSLVAKHNTPFIKKFRQLNSDIRSYRCIRFDNRRGVGTPRTLPLDPPLLWCPLISFLQHSVILTHQLLAIVARSELETQSL